MDQRKSHLVTRHNRPGYLRTRWSGRESLVQRLIVQEYINTVKAAVGVDISKEARELLLTMFERTASATAYNLNVDLKHVDAFARLAEDYR